MYVTNKTWNLKLEFHIIKCYLKIYSLEQNANRKMDVDLSVVSH